MEQLGKLTLSPILALTHHLYHNYRATMIAPTKMRRLEKTTRKRKAKIKMAKAMAKTSLNPRVRKAPPLHKASRSSLRWARKESR